MKTFTRFFPMQIATVFLWIVALSLSTAAPAQLLPTGEAETNTDVGAVSERISFVPGETIRIATTLTSKNGWHTYWINPGDSGDTTKLVWTLPEGFDVGEVKWPAPTRYETYGLVSYIYEDTVYLIQELSTPADFPVGETVQLNVVADFLECKEACVPGKGSASIQLTSVAENPQTDTDSARAMDAARIPSAPPSGIKATYSMNESGAVVFQFEADTGLPIANKLAFFPLDEGVWQLDPDFEISKQENRWSVTALPVEDAELPKTLTGLLVLNDETSFEFSATQESTLAPSASADVSPSEVGAETGGGVCILDILGYSVLAFFGGILLNLLPCVFPVIGLKVSSFIEQGQGNPKHAQSHAWVFALGVLVSVWILAAAVSLLKQSWGAQLADPGIVTGLILILTLLSLNMMGVFEWGNKLTTVGSGITSRKGYVGSFFTGALVTVIATPCTGPMLGGFMGWALIQPLWVVLLTFTLFGLGIALPYIALTYWPALMNRIPPPGNWMVTLKQAAGFFFVAFVWWMFWVLRKQVPVDHLMLVLASSFVIMFAAWVLGKWNHYSRPAGTRKIGLIAGWVLVAVGVGLAYSYRPPATEADDDLRAKILTYGEDVTPELAESLIAEGQNVLWRPYTPELLAELRDAGTPVFIDFTAEWCLTCKANKRTTLRKTDVEQAFFDAGVVTLVADLTNRENPVVLKALADIGRQSVPTYALYKAGEDVELLPELLTPDIVKNSLPSTN